MILPSPSDPIFAQSWLVRLRWGATLGQIAAVGFAGFVAHAAVPVLPVTGVVLTTTVSNLALSRARHAIAVPVAVILDLALLTVLLALTGGASNPFSVLYLLHVALAAVLLGPRWTWFVTGLASLGFAVLFPFTDMHAMHSQGMDGVNTHLWGMWLALGVTGAGIAWFVASLASALRDREAELARLRRTAERQERIVSLATLAAGAAHELGSPLAVIAVTAREVERMADELPHPDIAGDAREMRAQVERCKEIVSRLTQRAGASQGDVVTTTAIPEVWSELRHRLPVPDAGRVVWPPSEGDAGVRAPRAALLEALTSLLRNALQAGPGTVRIRADRAGAALRFVVEDDGAGIAPETIERVGEPFFTTRPAGEGMGLGVFIARRFAEGLGGGVDVASEVGRGTRVTLTVPAAA